jgi:very-short-patch-repair endonuclease
VARSLEKRAVFLKALGETGLMQDAAKAADVDLGLIYDWIKKDAEFGASVASVREEAKEEARRISSERRSAGARRAQSQLPAEVRESKAAKIQEYWTPERRAEKGEEFRERRADPEFQAKHLAGIRAYWDDPDTSTEARRRRSETSEALFADPEYREKFNAIMRTPEMRARRSAEASRQWAVMTEEERAARMAPMRKVISGGHRISRLEAKVMEYLNDHDVPYLTHKLVGGFVADLYIPALKLDIEADGDRWHTPDQMEREDLRDASLAAEGVTVLRMSEDEIRGGDFSRLHQALGVDD